MTSAGNLELRGHAPKARLSRRLITAGRYAAGLVILVILVAEFGPTDGWSTTLRGDSTLCTAAFLSFGLSRLSEAFRLYFLVPGRTLGSLRAIEIIFVSTFFNNFTAMVIGDGYRTIALWNAIKNFDTSLVVIIFDRLLGFMAILLLGLLYIPLFTHRFHDVLERIHIEALPSFFISILIIVLFFGICIAFFCLFFRRFRLFERVRNSADTARDIGRLNWALATASSLVSQLFVAGMTLALVRAYGADIGFADAVFVMLIVFVASYLPLSVGSLGVREGSVVLGLAAFGVGQPEALSVAIVSRIMIYQYALAAGIWFFFRRRKSPTGAADSS